MGFMNWLWSSFLALGMGWWVATGALIVAVFYYRLANERLQQLIEEKAENEGEKSKSALLQEQINLLNGQANLFSGNAEKDRQRIEKLQVLTDEAAQKALEKAEKAGAKEAKEKELERLWAMYDKRVAESERMLEVNRRLAAQLTRVAQAFADQNRLNKQIVCDGDTGDVTLLPKTAVAA